MDDDHVEGVVLGVVGLLGLMGSIGFVRYYSEAREHSFFTKTIGVLALLLCFFSVLLLPLDIYLLQSSRDHNTIKILYYFIYSLLIIFIAIVIPFAYFFYEEEDDTISTFAQISSACMYTFIFIVIAGLILSCGLLVGINSYNEDQDIGHVFSKFRPGDDSLAFCIGCFAVLGYINLISYTSIGLGYLPISLFPFFQKELIIRHDELSLQRQLYRTENKMQYLEARMDRGLLSDSERQQYQRINHHKKSLESALLDNEEFYQPDHSSVCSKISRFVLFPFKLILSVLCISLSFLLVISLLVSLFDRILHSSCKFHCGFQLNETNYVNPLNNVFVHLSTWFPSDYICFAILISYMFICSMDGMVHSGVRLFFIKVYNIHPYKTMQNALLLGIWNICFVCIAINFQMISVLPQYSTFGHQQYDTKESGTIDCSWKSASSNHCIVTKASSFYNTLLNRFPVFGTIFLLCNLIFCITFFFAFVYSITTLSQKRIRHQSISISP